MTDQIDALFDRIRRGAFSGTDPNETIQQAPIGGDNIQPTGWYGGFGFSSSIGVTNALLDPLFQTIKSLSLTTSYQTQGFWRAKYTLNSGTAPTSISISPYSGRTRPDTQPFQTVAQELAVQWGTSVCDMDVYLEPANVYNPDFLFPFIVAACRFYASVDVTSGLDTATACVEVVDDTDTVLLASDTWDLTTAADTTQRYLWASLPVDTGDLWRIRLHFNFVKSSGASAQATPVFGEPQLQYGFQGDPLPFAPMVGNWDNGYLSGVLVYSSVASPNQITADTNNYNPPQNIGQIVRLRLSTDAARSLTGIVNRNTNGASVIDGHVLVIHNVGSFTITLKHDDSGSDAANRFYCPGSTDYSLTTNSTVTLYYDATSSRWRVGN